VNVSSGDTCTVCMQDTEYCILKRTLTRRAGEIGGLKFRGPVRSNIFKRTGVQCVSTSANTRVPILIEALMQYCIQDTEYRVRTI
jgi:hypothetical protein